MAGHFGAIGFPVATREELEALGVLAANLGEPHEAGSLLYLRWVAGAGAELWAQAERDTKKIKGVVPYFASEKAALEGTVEEVLPSPKRPHDGSIAFIPAGDERRAALAGVPIALPDFQVEVPRLARGASARLSVAAFAHAFEVVPESVPAEGGLAPGVMLPAPRGLALVAGRVVAAEKRTNPSGRRDFIWALVGVTGGTIDVLIDPELESEAPEKGQACRGVFWLSARRIA